MMDETDGIPLSQPTPGGEQPRKTLDDHYVYSEFDLAKKLQAMKVTPEELATLNPSPGEQGYRMMPFRYNEFRFDLPDDIAQGKHKQLIKDDDLTRLQKAADEAGCGLTVLGEPGGKYQTYNLNPGSGPVTIENDIAPGHKFIMIQGNGGPKGLLKFWAALAANQPPSVQK